MHATATSWGGSAAASRGGSAAAQGGAVAGPQLLVTGLLPLVVELLHLVARLLLLEACLLLPCGGAGLGGLVADYCPSQQILIHPAVGCSGQTSQGVTGESVAVAGYRGGLRGGVKG